MTTVELPDLELEEPDEDQLVKNGRYRIYMNPTDEKPKLFTRATTWADTLDDLNQIVNWKGRMVARGLAMNSSLVELILSIPEDDKDALASATERAIQEAGGDNRATRGTAGHGFFAQILCGKDVYVPDSTRHNVEAALNCLAKHGLTPLPDMVEAVVVCNELGVAGRDDLVCVDQFGQLVVTDLKTGDGLEEYARLKTSIQLAIYAHAETVYDPETRTHRPMPRVRRDIAYVLHRPLDTDVCQLIKVDIDAGWGYASELVPAVRAARNHGKRKGKDSLFEVVPEPPEEITAARLLPADQLRIWILGRLNALDDHPLAKKQMRAGWPEGVPSFSSGHEHSDNELRLIAVVLDDVERRFSVPFGSTPQREEPKPIIPPDERIQLPPQIDEGGPVDRENVTGIIAILDRLPEAQAAVLKQWAREAHETGYSITIKLAPTKRRLAIYRAMVALAPLTDSGLGTDRARAVIASVRPSAASLDIPLGAELGTFTIAEADQLHDAALKVRSDDNAPDFDLKVAVMETFPNSTTVPNDSQDKT